MQEIANNVAAIRARMAEAAREAGRDPAEITLCAASKMNDAQRVRAAVEAGVDCCGENRVQELVEKLPQGAYGQKPVHFIGHLQTNKVNKVVGHVDLIQSVDRLELLAAIEKQAAKLGLVQKILFEVNIGAEASNPASPPPVPWTPRPTWPNTPLPFGGSHGDSTNFRGTWRKFKVFCTNASASC